MSHLLPVNLGQLESVSRPHTPESDDSGNSDKTIKANAQPPLDGDQLTLGNQSVEHWISNTPTAADNSPKKNIRTRIGGDFYGEYFDSQETITHWGNAPGPSIPEGLDIRRNAYGRYSNARGHILNNLPLSLANETLRNQLDPLASLEDLGSLDSALGKGKERMALSADITKQPLVRTYIDKAYVSGGPQTHFHGGTHNHPLSPSISGDYSTIELSYSYFRGEEEVKTIEKDLNHEHEAPLTTLRGIPGSGKSQLAYKYANLHRDKYHIACMIGASNVEEMTKSFRTLGKNILGKVDSDKLKEIDAPSDAIRFVLSKLHEATNKQILLILDDLNGRELFDPYFLPNELDQNHNQIKHMHTIITTRKYDLQIGSSNIRVGMLDDESAVNCMQKMIFGKISENNRKTFQKIANKLDNHPLAITHAAAYLRQNASQFIGLGVYHKSRVDKDIDTYIREYSEIYKKSKASNKEEKSIFATFKMAIDAIEAQTRLKGAWEVLTLASFFGNKKIPVSLFEHIDNADGESLASTDTTESGSAEFSISSFARVEKVLKALADFSIIEFHVDKEENLEKFSISMKRLVQAVAQDPVRSKEVAWGKSMLENATLIFPEEINETNVNSSEDIISCANRLVADFPKNYESSALAHVHYLNAAYHFNTGRHDKAEKSISIAREIYGHSRMPDDVKNLSRCKKLHDRITSAVSDRTAILAAESQQKELEEPISPYRAKLEERHGESVGLDWAAVEYSFGDVLVPMGEHETLEEAIAFHHAALERQSRDRVPFLWANTQDQLGIALLTLGERGPGTAHLIEAVAAFRAAAETRPCSLWPLQGAKTQQNLGNALLTLGDRVGGREGAAHLEEAITAFRSALEQLPPGRERGKLQHNLGNALLTIGERGSGTAHLEEGVVAYRAALKERLQNLWPLQWAKTQHNLGNTLLTLGERVPGTGHLKEAVTAYRSALLELTRERAPGEWWATTQNNLGDALLTLGEREGELRSAHLEEAVVAFRAALEEWTRERWPWQSAGTQHHLGNTLLLLGEREAGTMRLKEAVTAYRAALETLPREYAPAYWWETTQDNLNNALRILKERAQSRFSLSGISRRLRALRNTRDAPM